MWETQDGKFTTSKKLKVYFCLPKFSVTKIAMWKCHVDKSTTSRCNMVLGKYLITALRLDLMFSENIIIGGK